jgi:taurine dioxygenase
MSTLDISRPPGPIGAAIDGADLATEVGDADFRAIADTVDLPSADLVRFARRFGAPQVNVRAEANNGDIPEIFWVTNVSKDGVPLGSHDAGRYWHSDLCYLKTPSDLTLLHALEVPAKDGVSYGATQFASATAAYDALPEEIKTKLEGKTARNGYRFMWNRKDDAVHPIFRTHPRTGRKCLYVCDGYTHRIDGLPEDESRELLAFLFEHLKKPEFRYSHDWQVGDLLIWDNCAVQHKARFDYPPELRRVMQRCTIEGGVPY